MSMRTAALFLLLAMLVLIPVAKSAPGAEAQTPALSLSDLQHEGFTIMTEAVVIGGASSLWFQRSPRSPQFGSISEGGLNLVDGVNSYPITAVAGDSDGAFIRLNDSSALSLSAYFNGSGQTGDDGEGGDLVVLIQTTATTAPVKISISADTTRPGPGGGYINMAVPPGNHAEVADITTGSRFILALARVSVPANVAATADGQTAVDVSWDAVPQATGYTVEWSTASDFATSTTAEATGTSHRITGLAAATTYHVRVKTNRTGFPDSRHSAVVSVDTEAPSNRPPVFSPATQAFTVDENAPAESSIGTARRGHRPRRRHHQLLGIRGQQYFL